MASRRIRRTKSLAGYTAAVYQDLIDLKARNNSRSIAGSAIDGGTLAEEIELINKSLQSSNYIPGADGWKITGAGDAEFGNVFVRGDINAYSGTIGYWNISNPAVERTFGGTTLFGTFLESFDHGFTDEGATTGSYVSLFKSYVDIPIAITKISVTSDVVTLTAPDHNFIIGDKITIEFDSATYLEYESNTYLVVTEITPDTFSYIKRLADSGEDGNTIAEVEVSGLAQIYNEDIAGLYLRDYSKREFDYGYFSNKGISYVSAEDVNLIENPSFEFTDDAGLLVPSSASWSTALGSGLSLSNIDIYEFNDSSSIYGGALSWTTVSTGYLSGKIDYAVGNVYKLFDIAKPLYFDLTTFPSYDSATITVTAMVSHNVSTNWFLEVTTSTSHGLTAGDSVFFNFNATYSSETYLPHTLPNGSSGYTYVVAASPAPTTTKFYIDVDGTFPAPGVSVVRTERPEQTTTNEIYKVYEAALDLSAIRLRYPNGQTTNLYDVLSPLTKTQWDAGTNKYLISYANDYMIQYLDPEPDSKIAPIPKTSSLVVSSAAIADAYQVADPTSFADGLDIYLDLPGWMLKHDGNGAVSETKLATTGYIVDNVYLSTSPNFFYGSELATNRWYATTKDVISYNPAQASIEGTKTWINIDLATQAATLDYFNQIGFRNNTFTKSMVSRPSAGTQDETPIYQPFTDSEYETTTFSGGIYQHNQGGGSYHILGSSLKLITGGRSSGFELSSDFKYTLDGDVIGRQAAVISGSYDNYTDGVQILPRTTIRIGSDRLVWAYDVENLSDPASEQIIIDKGENLFGTDASLTSNIPVTVSNAIAGSSTTIDGGTIASSGTITSTDTGTGFHANGGDIQSTAGNIYTTAGDIYTTVGNVYTSNGRVTANTARLTSTTDYSLSSTTHPFQIGPTNSNNIRMDDNGIQTVNNGSAAALNINTFGGDINVGGTGTTVNIGNASTNVILRNLNAFNSTALTGGQALYVSSGGLIAKLSSTRRLKQNIQSTDVSADAILSVEPRKFKYKSDVAEFGDEAKYAYGFIAEELHDAGLYGYVTYDEAGVPDGVQYALYVSALQAVVRHQASQIQSLSDRLDALEGN